MISSFWKLKAAIASRLAAIRQSCSSSPMR
jgi:hypothetical protein